MTHEIHIQSLQNKNNFKKKGLALKATEEEPNNDESSSSSSEDSIDANELTMLSKRVQRLMKRGRRAISPRRIIRNLLATIMASQVTSRLTASRKRRMISLKKRMLTRRSSTRKARGPWRQPDPMKMLHLVNHPESKKLVKWQTMR